MSTDTHVSGLQKLAAELDAELAKHLPPAVMAMVHRRIMTARLLEARVHLQSFERQCDLESQPLPSLLQIQAG